MSRIINENTAQQRSTSLHRYEVFAAETKDTTHSAHLGRLWDILQWGVAEAAPGWSALKDLLHHVALRSPSWKSLRKTLLPVPGKGSERQQTQRAAVTLGCRKSCTIHTAALALLGQEGNGGHPICRLTPAAAELCYRKINWGWAAPQAKAGTGSRWPSHTGRNPRRLPQGHVAHPVRTRHRTHPREGSDFPWPRTLRCGWCAHSSSETPTKGSCCNAQQPCS